MHVKGISLKELEFYNKKINDFYLSEKFQDMSKGMDYFKGKHDILHKKRMIIGESGELSPVSNLPNNQIIDNQYRKAVEQKLNYLLGKPLTIFYKENDLTDKIVETLGNDFSVLIRNVGLDAINCGIGWVYIYYNSMGKLCFKRFSPKEVIPFWADEEHKTLHSFIRIISKENLDGDIINLAEIYRNDGIYTYSMENEELNFLSYRAYFYINGAGFCWDSIPLIPFKYNCDEYPLIKNVKSLQDGINEIESDFLNVMQEDSRNSIFVLVNYDGENLGEFRRNLAAYGAVKVRSGEGEGDVRTLNVSVNANNYLSILNVFKKAMIENAKAFDARNEKIGMSTNQLTVKSMYSDIDLDANGMEAEFLSGIKHLFRFVGYHLKNRFGIDCDTNKINVIFNRDMLMNESEIISNIVKSGNILSKETLISQHPWVNNVFEEKEKLLKQKYEKGEN